jgi:hypothetical protein
MCKKKEQKKPRGSLILVPIFLSFSDHIKIKFSLSDFVRMYDIEIYAQIFYFVYSKMCLKYIINNKSICNERKKALNLEIPA